MKKFSKVTSTSSPEIEEKITPKTEKELEEERFKVEVSHLMDDLLSIRTYGPIDRYRRAGNTKISGKEMFIDALIDILKDRDVKVEKKVLERIKIDNSYNKSIDLNINILGQKIQESENRDKILSKKHRMESIYNKYGDDKDMFMRMIKESSNKMINDDNVYFTIIALNEMIDSDKYPKNLLFEACNIFKIKYKGLKNI
jgi:hypothetical protein